MQYKQPRHYDRSNDSPQGPEMLNLLMGSGSQMPLEQNQSIHNSVLSATKNHSGSNDIQQIQHDMNETLINGAQLLHHGRSAGLSDDQTMQAAMLQLSEMRQADTGIEQRQLIQKSKTNAADDSIMKEIMSRRK